MAWSTQQIADLAGTTVNTVRHYHRTGLLEQPDRLSNGYKQYGVRHLVRLLQIRRLRDLGVPLDQIDEVGADSESPAEALRALDAELTASIERLQRARVEIAAILQGSTATEVPSGFEEVASRLSKPERSLVMIYKQLYDDRAMDDVRAMIQQEPDDASVALENLPSDADEDARQQLAEQYAPALARDMESFPWLLDPTAHLSRTPQVTSDTIAKAAEALFNPAQYDVLIRASIIAWKILGRSPSDPGANPSSGERSPTADPPA
ncbi:MerR family transcriptional regulator [Herbiconiux sp. L3-i23]|uniref:MerR family transcriptional regulator n=1 Tax=Herbiconiux sp. L3-i23 TaxID=2905871 RepID=UPI00204C630A|nr:MerR family transcriptional regulator [Herbiconiux sp. L3-i23]BDI23693.1 transcriptional regulator, MerR family protein [Herbiconiux sp. L3-i23]